MKKLFVYLACSSIMMLPLVSCSDDDPDVPGQNDPTTEVTFPILSAHEFGSYSVRDKGLSIIAHNLTATANGKSYKPTEYYLTTTDGKRINLKQGTIVSDNPDDTVLLEGSCQDLDLGYNDVTLTAVYGDIKTSDNKVSESIRISVVSRQPVCAVKFNNLQWGAWSDVRIDPDGSTHIHQEPGRTIVPAWNTTKGVLTLNLGGGFNFPENNNVEFEGDVVLTPAIDADNSNFDWTMSDPVWHSAGTSFNGSYTFNVGPTEAPNPFTLSLEYKVKGTMDGVTISETQRRSIEVKVTRN